MADGPESGIAAALADARTRYTADNPASHTAHERTARVTPGGNTRSVLHVDPFPLCFAGGSGSTLTDLDGHRYDDFLADFTAGLFGHSDPRLIATLQACAREGLNLGGHSLAEAELAESLVARFPALEQVRFTNSGTEANLMAIAAARTITGRDRLLIFDGAYHGGVLSFGQARRSNVPFDYLLATYNDLDGTRALIRQHGTGLAAILVEPMLQSGGCVPADPDFLRMLAAEARSSGALLIFDEVVTSRLAPGGVHGALGIRPDLVTLGKYLGGGSSFGAFGGRREVMARFDPRRPDYIQHGGTFNNDRLTMALATVAIRDIFTPDAALRLNARGEALRHDLNARAERHGLPMQFTGAGSIMSAHMTDRPVRCYADQAAEDVALRDLFYFHLLERGIYIARRGMLSLSLAITEEQITRLVDAVESFCTIAAGLATRR